MQLALLKPKQIKKSIPLCHSKTPYHNSQFTTVSTDHHMYSFKVKQAQHEQKNSQYIQLIFHSGSGRTEFNNCQLKFPIAIDR